MLSLRSVRSPWVSTEECISFQSWRLSFHQNPLHPYTYIVSLEFLPNHILIPLFYITEALSTNFKVHSKVTHITSYLLHVFISETPSRLKSTCDRDEICLNWLISTAVYCFKKFCPGNKTNLYLVKNSSPVKIMKTYSRRLSSCTVLKRLVETKSLLTLWE